MCSDIRERAIQPVAQHWNQAIASYINAGRAAAVILAWLIPPIVISLSQRIYVRRTNVATVAAVAAFAAVSKSWTEGSGPCRCSGIHRCIEITHKRSGRCRCSRCSGIHRCIKIAHKRSGRCRCSPGMNLTFLIAELQFGKQNA